jgi:hypothetical protein
MGDAYCMGIGVRPSGGTARRWWQLAMAHGDSHAKRMLSEKLCTGHHSRVSPGQSPEI